MNASITAATATVKTTVPTTSSQQQSSKITNLILSPSMNTKYVKLNNGNRSLASFQQQMPHLTTSANSFLTNNSSSMYLSTNRSTKTFQNYLLSNNSINNQFDEVIF